MVIFSESEREGNVWFKMARVIQESMELSIRRNKAMQISWKSNFKNVLEFEYKIRGVHCKIIKIMS